MGVAYDFDTISKVLEFSEPFVYNGSWEGVKFKLVEAGEISESAGVVQKVVTINEAASSTATAGETLSALCAMDVSESTVAGATVTTLTPKAAITFTPKTVALCGIAGALGLDFGFRIGQNLVNLYYGDDWDWHAPGIFDKAKDAIRTYVKADGTTYYDEETINAFSNRLNEIGAFEDVSFPPITVKEYNISDVPKLSLIDSFNRWFSQFNHANPSSVTVENIKKVLAYTLSNLGKVPYNNYISTFQFYNNETLSQSIYFYDLSVYNKIIFNRNKDSFSARPSITTLGISFVYDPQKNEFSTFYYDSNLSNSYHDLLSSNIGTKTGIDGVEKQSGATVPSTFPLEIPETYPNWQPSPINKPDGANQTYPIEMPDTDPLSEKATKHQNEAQKGVNQDPENNPVIGSAIGIVQEILPNIPTPQVPTIDDGDTPIPIIPAIGVQGTGFVALYNPTQSQLSAFSQYLWSNDFIENFKKLFSNPMDAIIGLHLIYATPSRGDEAEIVCGYSHSGVMSNTVNNQYIEIDCGGIKVNRYFGSVLDYAPYTKLQVYLPFVGIVDLDTNEIMDGTLNIKYRIDVLTGSCLARLKITRGDYNAELYNFAGNCAVQLPISGGSYSGIIANAIGVAGSLGATIATGGAMAPVLVGGVVSSAVNSHTNVSHSGSLGSNAGALGIMKPYLIITRPKPAEADNFNKFYGKPSNKTVRLSSCSGYTRVKDVHIEKISIATDDELSEIESLLKEGVII